MQSEKQAPHTEMWGKKACSNKRLAMVVAQRQTTSPHATDRRIFQVPPYRWPAATRFHHGWPWLSGQL